MAIERIALATRKGLLVLQREPTKWNLIHESFPGVHVSYVFIDRRSGHLYAAIADGHFGVKWNRWSGFSDCNDIAAADPADVWQEFPAPRFPEDCKLIDGRDAVLNYIWAVAAGSESQPGRIYVGTEPGGLFVSDDHGESFKLVRGLWDHPSRTDPDMPWMGGGMDNPGIHSICVDPRDDRVIRVGVSVAGVFETVDGGASWAPRNRGLRADFLPDPHVEVGHDPHLLVQSAGDPDKLWQQNHCGIFRSSDRGNSWCDVSEAKPGPANFGFAVGVDHQDGDVAWVIPAESDMVRAAVDRKLCVCRTDDGGQTWKKFSSGLPQTNCYDFAFRHGLIVEGDELVFGTACGSVYWSQDRGESWECLGNHFPPIYCVDSV